MVDPDPAHWSVLSAAAPSHEWIGHQYNGRGELPHGERLVV